MASTSLEKDFQINPFDLSNNSDSKCNAFSSNPFGGANANPFGADSINSNISQSKDEGKKKESATVSAKTARKLHDLQKDKEYDGNKCFKSYLLYVEEETFKNKKPAHLQLPKNLKIDKEALDLTGDEDLEKIRSNWTRGQKNYPSFLMTTHSKNSKKWLVTTRFKYYVMT